MRKIIYLILLMCVIVLGGCGEKEVTKEKIIEQLNETNAAVTKKTGAIHYSFDISYEKGESDFEIGIDIAYFASFDLIRYSYYAQEISKTEVDEYNNAKILSSTSKVENIFIIDNKLYIEKTQGIDSTYKIYSTSVTETYAAEKKKIDDQLDSVFFNFANKANIVAAFTNYAKSDGEKYEIGNVNYAENEYNGEYVQFNVTNIADRGNSKGPSYHLFDIGVASYSNIPYFDSEENINYLGDCQIIFSGLDANIYLTTEYIALFTE